MYSINIDNAVRIRFLFLYKIVLPIIRKQKKIKDLSTIFNPEQKYTNTAFIPAINNVGNNPLNLAFKIY